MVESSRMRVSGFGRVAVLLLVAWLNADLAAFGSCSGELVRPSAPTVNNSAADHSDDASPCCRGHHCFCCSSAAEVAAFKLPVEEQAATVTSSTTPHAPHISIAQTSPPPRL